MKVGRPVKLIYRRDEDMRATTKRHPARVRIRSMCGGDGALLRWEADILMDGGAYNTLSPVVLSRAVLHVTGPYRCPDVFLRGRWGQCRAPISMRYPLVEIATALLSVVVALQFGASWLTLAALLLTWALIALTMIDIDHQLLPDSITLPLLWLGLIVNSQGLLVPLDDALWGAVFGYLSLWSVYWGFKLLTGKEGMGYGDFKLLAALGAWLGWQALPMVIILSSLVGAVIGIAMILLLGRDKNVPIPFGPYLAIAGWIVLLWGDVLSGHFRLLSA